jgi:hypothetical protein
VYLDERIVVLNTDDEEVCSGNSSVQGEEVILWCIGSGGRVVLLEPTDEVVLTMTDEYVTVAFLVTIEELPVLVVETFHTSVQLSDGSSVGSAVLVVRPPPLPLPVTKPDQVILPTDQDR